MTPLQESEIHPAIFDALKDVQVAKSVLSSVVEECQQHCEHRVVSETSWCASNQPARRICNHCRFTEEGSHWSGGNVWSLHDYSPATLGNTPGRLVLNITRDEYYEMRIL